MLRRGFNKKRYYNEMGFTRRTAQTTSWRERSPEVQAFCTTDTTAKTADTAGYAAHVRHILKHMDTLMDFYVTKKRYRRLAWGTAIASKSGLAKLATDIMGCTGVNKRVLIAHGDSGMAHTRGCAPMGNKRLLRELSRRATVVLVDEFRTSKNCCACHKPMAGFEMTKGEGDEAKTFHSYGVRRCKTSECLRTWNRDVS